MKKLLGIKFLYNLGACFQKFLAEHVIQQSTKEGDVSYFNLTHIACSAQCLHFTCDLPSILSEVSSMGTCKAFLFSLHNVQTDSVRCAKSLNPAQKQVAQVIKFANALTAKILNEAPKFKNECQIWTSKDTILCLTKK